MDLSVVKEELRKVINANCVDTSCGVPDFVLAEHLLDTLLSVRRTYKKANTWRGIPDFKPGQKVTVG